MKIGFAIFSVTATSNSISLDLVTGSTLKLYKILATSAFSVTIANLFPKNECYLLFIFLYQIYNLKINVKWFLYTVYFATEIILNCSRSNFLVLK